MNGDEQVGLHLVGSGGALLERNKCVVLACVNHFRARKLVFDQVAQAQGHIEAEIFFHQAVGADGSSVVAAVAGVNHDAADFQAQRTGQRTLAIPIRLGFCRGQQHGGFLNARLGFG